MILVLDTTERIKNKIGLFEKQFRLFEYETSDQAKELLRNIEESLKKKNSGLEKITKILVNLGPGSFTGVRVGVAVANTLAWSLNIPVYGYKGSSLEEKIKEIEILSQKNFESIVLPSYN